MNTCLYSARSRTGVRILPIIVLISVLQTFGLSTYRWQTATYLCFDFSAADIRFEHVPMSDCRQFLFEFSAADVRFEHLPKSTIAKYGTFLFAYICILAFRLG